MTGKILRHPNILAFVCGSLCVGALPPYYLFLLLFAGLSRTTLPDRRGAVFPKSVRYCLRIRLCLFRFRAVLDWQRFVD